MSEGRHRANSMSSFVAPEQRQPPYTEPVTGTAPAQPQAPWQESMALITSRLDNLVQSFQQNNQAVYQHFTAVQQQSARQAELALEVVRRPIETRPPTRAVPGLSPPTFSGEDSSYTPGIWIHDMKRFFLAALLDDEVHKFNVMTAKLRGPASLWFRSLERENTAPTNMETFERALLARFQPESNEQILRDKLFGLTQTGSISEYTKEFQLYSSQINTMSQQDQIAYFVRGLKKITKLQVQARSPKSLSDAIAHACSVEAALFPTRAVVTTTSHASHSDSMEIDFVSTNVRSTNVNNQERQADLKFQRCFRCHNRGHQSKNCPMRKSYSGNVRKTQM